MSANSSQSNFPPRASNSLSRLRELFEAAVELPAHEREAWLAAHAADNDERDAVLQLLGEDENVGALDVPAIELHARLAAVELRSDDLIGQQIAGFQIKRPLGRGGMAAVFLGERIGKDFTQDVAIKLLRRGLYSALEQRLFQRERQLLAALDHPNIARLIDGGVTDAGIPYLVLEFVDGVPITRYADEHRLDVAQCLALFLAVCRAVESAHQRLIVHRDIKPSNILVTDLGDVKLLDFGIAKLLEDDAESPASTQAVFTPEYAAPEQLRGGTITTATDVYGLGVLLHELLVGLKPVANSNEGSGPHRPSSRVPGLKNANAASNSQSFDPEQRRRMLRGDLDNILLKALESEPERRYASAGAFADDIDRYLQGRPVAAHAPTRWYRAHKFIQRHRGGVTVTAILVVAIFAALGLALWQAKVARQQTQAALAQSQRAQAVKVLLVGLFNNEIPERGKMPDTALLDEGAKRARTELAGTPDVQVEMLTALGHVYTQLAQPDKSEPLLNLAVDVARRLDPPDPALLGAALSERAGVDLKRNNYKQAIDLYNQAVTLQQRADSQSLTLAETLVGRALAFGETGKFDEAMADYRSAVAIREMRLPPNDLQILDVYEKMGSAYDREGRPNEATQYLRTAMDAARAKLGDAHVTTTRYMKNYALNLGARHQYKEATVLTEQAVQIQRTLYPKGHPDIANGINNLGYLYLMFGRLHAAQDALNEVRAINRDAGLGKSRGEIFVVSNLEAVQEAFGENVQALALVIEGKKIAIDVVGAEHPLSLRLALRQARLEFDAKPDGQTATALLLAAQKITEHPEKLGQFRVADETDALLATGRAQAVLGHDHEAETALRAAFTKLPDDYIDPNRLPVVIALTEWERDHNQTAAAESLLRGFLARAERELPPTHYALGELRLALGEILAANGRAHEAMEILFATETAFTELPASHPWRQRVTRLQHALSAH